MDKNKLVIGSYNCNGLANNIKRNEVFKWLKDKNMFDILCLQETHSMPKDENKWMREWGGHVFFSHGSSNKRGVLILIQRNAEYVVHTTLRDSDGRWIIVDLTVKSIRLCLVNLYAPNTDDALFFECIQETVQSLKGCGPHTIITGDFNTVMDSMIDRTGCHSDNYHPQALKAIQMLMSTLDLIDIWRLS